MKKQTAVDWTLEEIESRVTKVDHGKRELHITLSFEEFMEIKKQARAMNEEQLVTAFFKGNCDGYNTGVSVYSDVEFQSGENYYKQTYEQTTDSN